MSEEDFPRLLRLRETIVESKVIEFRNDKANYIIFVKIEEYYNSVISDMERDVKNGTFDKKIYYEIVIKFSDIIELLTETFSIEEDIKLITQNIKEVVTKIREALVLKFIKNKFPKVTFQEYDGFIFINIYVKK